ncbi:hypothetical protein [Flavobacterium sp.]|uniref:hypothetical protein n=1 Tax=Flavobacterium sp. TaxID=239 RepID=UPI00260C5D52|nr:hypothetical protein [Flavobacterium sp.]
MENDIVRIFSRLHDGGIEAWSFDDNILKLQVSCLYLAEMINPEFEFFYIEIPAVESLSLTCHLKDEESCVLTSPDEIFSGELEIISAESFDDKTVIHLYQGDVSAKYIVAELHLKASEIHIYQHEKSEINVDFLSKISDDYWTNFGK